MPFSVGKIKRCRTPLQVRGYHICVVPLQGHCHVWNRSVMLMVISRGGVSELVGRRIASSRHHEAL